MDRQGAIDILNRVLHGTVNSVLQYIDASQPHVPAGCEEHVDTLARLKNEETESATEIHALIGELDGVPKVGVFPYWNVDLNFLDLRFMARFAAKHIEKVLAEMEAELEQVKEDARVHGVLRRAYELKQAHLATLREIGGA